MVAALRKAYGPDRSLPVTYLRWVRPVLRGDLGFSFAYNSPVWPLLEVRAAKWRARTILPLSPRHPLLLQLEIIIDPGRAAQMYAFLAFACGSSIIRAMVASPTLGGIRALVLCHPPRVAPSLAITKRGRSDTATPGCAGKTT